MKSTKFSLFLPQLCRIGIFTLIWLALMLVLFGQSGSTPVAAAPIPFILRWDDLSPDVSGTPDFITNDPIGPEANTNLSLSAMPHTDPYHGLASATGGVTGFASQTFTNAAVSGVDMVVYYSRNQHDGMTGDVLEGPDLYGPPSCTFPTCNDVNPDRLVTGEWALRVTRDYTDARTPVTVVLSFSAPVYLYEFIVGSLSEVSGSYEHAIVRGFSSADATGPVVKASGLINISNLTDGSTLINGFWDPTGPTTSNGLANLAVEPSLIDSNADGVYENIGDGTDDGVYHLYGAGLQTSDPTTSHYGRAKWVYGDAPVRSIAISYFPTSTANGTPFDDTTYTEQWISAIFAAVAFSEEAPTAVTLQNINAAAAATNTFLIIIMTLVLLLIGASRFYYKQRQHNQTP